MKKQMISHDRKLKIWSWIPKGGPAPRRTSRLTVGRKFNFNCILSSELAYRNKKKLQLSQDNFQEEKEHWPQIPDGGPISGQTGRQTVGRKINRTSCCCLVELVKGKRFIHVERKKVTPY
jgi:hypothetical protein